MECLLNHRCHFIIQEKQKLMAVLLELNHAIIWDVGSFRKEFPLSGLPYYYTDLLIKLALIINK